MYFTILHFVLCECGVLDLVLAALHFTLLNYRLLVAYIPPMGWAENQTSANYSIWVGIISRLTSSSSEKGLGVTNQI